MIFDSHAHYDDEAFEEDRDAVIAQLAENGIGHVIDVGASLASTRRAVELAEKHAMFFAAAGVHPSETEELNEENFSYIRECCGLEKVVAVGEIGLDYYYPDPPKQVQKEWFERQLALARECQLPEIIHSRDAAKDTIDILKAAGQNPRGGVIHCYSYTKETAQEFLKMDYHFGIGGVITFKNGRKLREAVEMIPMERILLETDCPYLAPEPFRGKRCSSLYLPYVVEQIAQIKGIDAAEVERITWQNACRLFGIADNE